MNAFLLQAGQTAVFAITTTRAVAYYAYQVHDNCKFYLPVIISQTSILNALVFLIYFDTEKF